MGGSGDWGMPRSSASPVGSMMRPGLEYNSKAMMSGPMAGRSNSIPGTSLLLHGHVCDTGSRRQRRGRDTHTTIPVFHVCITPLVSWGLC